MLALFVAAMAPVRANGQTPSVVAVVTTPPNGTTTANFSQPIQWTSIAGAQAYYLYVGSSPGAKDLINTGEIQVTSHSAATLPRGVKLYVRLWTKMQNIWQYTDSQIESDVAMITSPPANTVTFDLRQPITWTSVAGTQAYYLYVGSSPGAKDLINSGEIQATSYSALTLPHSVLLYARIWTKRNGLWNYSDSTFTSDVATLVAPQAGAGAVDLRQPIQWTPIAGALAYYLYVGSSIGAKDFINTGEIQATSYPASTLPRGVPLFARIYTKLASGWTWSDSTFQSNVATITSPATATIDLHQPIQWAPVPSAQAYYLYVGSAPGLKDLINTGEIHATSYSAVSLPAGQMLYARIWTKFAGVWNYTDAQFIAGTAVITSPANGTVGFDPNTAIVWTTIPAAQCYYLYVGTTKGAKDLVNTGETQATSYVAPLLPRDRLLYARMWTKRNDIWSYADSTFTAKSFGPRVQSTSLVHAGAFRVPGGLHAGGLANAGFEYGGTAIGFNPANDSLFIVGHNWDQFAAEITIPTVVNGPIAALATAAVLQPLTDPLDGEISEINPSDSNTKLIGGILPTEAGLVITAYSYYDGLNTQSASHFVRPMTLSATGSLRGPYRVGDVGTGYVSGYLGLVPLALQGVLGGPLLTGQAGIPLISRTSYGPDTGTFDPATFGVDNPAPWNPLVGYPQDHETLGAWAQSNPLFSGGDQTTGSVLPVGTSTVLFFGRHGETFCYGVGTSDPTLAGLPADDLDPYCYDPWDSSKGVHGYPYQSYVWAYDVNDLVGVRAGRMSPWDVTPYAVWELPDLGGSGIGGAAYDPATGRIFVSQLLGDSTLPLIHVYTLSLQQ